MNEPLSMPTELPEPVLDPARQVKAKRYARLHRYLGLADTTLGAVLILLLVFAGLSVKLRDLIALPTIPAGVVYFAILMLVFHIISAPLDYYRGFVLPRRYGLLQQPFSGWLGDEAKSALLGLGFASAFVAILYLLILAMPTLWWLAAWGIITVVSIVLSALAPILIIPLFFKMKPMADNELKQRLEALTRRANFKIGGVYIIELSRKGNTANAGLMGSGRTKRIVLSDTLLNQYSPEEIEVITAHELGHNMHRDTLRLLLLQTVVFLVGFFVLDIVFRALVTPLGFNGITDIAALPLLAAIFGLFSFLLGPLLNSYHRKIEAEADGFALTLTDQPAAFISSMAKLTEQNLGDAYPNAWIERLTYDHPSYYHRVQHARDYAVSRKGAAA